MSVGPVDLLNWAKSNSSSKDETTLRASISRAYYAAYHACRTWHARLPVPGRSQSKGGRHDELISQLEHPDQACTAPQSAKSRKLANALRDVRAIRVVADYDLDAAVRRVTAEEACAKAEILVSMTK